MLTSPTFNPTSQLEEDDLLNFSFCDTVRKTVNKIYEGIVLQPHGARQQISQVESLMDMYVMGGFMSVIMFFVFAYIVYQIFELSITIVTFLNTWIIVFSFLILLVFVSYSLIKEVFKFVIAVKMYLTWFATTVLKKGMISTLVLCLKMSFNAIICFWEIKEEEEEEEKPEFGFGFSEVSNMYFFVKWLVNSFYSRGILTTIKKVIFCKSVQSINVAYKYWVEPDVKTSLLDLSNISKSLEERSVESYLATKIAKLFTTIYYCIRFLLILEILYFMLWVSLEKMLQGIIFCTDYSNLWKGIDNILNIDRKLAYQCASYSYCPIATIASLLRCPIAWVGSYYSLD